MYWVRGQFVVVAALLCWSALPALQVAGDERVAFFENQVRPLLARRCYGCHGARKQESGLRLDSKSALLRGGRGGAVVVPGDAARSRLVEYIERLGAVKMPPDRPLIGREVVVLRQWIAQGAFFPVGEAGYSGQAVTPETFWSLRQLQSVGIPEGGELSAERDSIDRFVGARLAGLGLTLGKRAERRALLRRASYGLTGLPPTAAEATAYRVDHSPDAFERVVDRLLGSPAHGEKWGRHWLDLVRYADTAGETADFPVPQAYLYRNYVINAHNVDKPYDVFLREQVAGDLMAEQLVVQRRYHTGKAGPTGFEPDLSALDVFFGDQQLAARYRELVTATGFLAISRRFGFSADADHHLTIQDSLDTVGQAVLGFSLGCARCHDHKYDPVSTEDYYAWYGILASTRYAYPGSEGENRPRDLTPVIPRATARHRRQEFLEEEKRVEAEVVRLSARRIELENLLRPYAAVIAEVGPAEWVWNPYLSAVRGLLFGDYVANDAGHRGYHVYRPVARGIPLMAVNASAETLRVPGVVPPGGLVVHPDTNDAAAIAWQSPLDGRVRVSGSVSDVHDCGNGVLWHLDHLGAAGFQSVATGAVGRASVHRFGSDSDGDEDPLEVDVRRGDLLQLVISMNGDLGCDLTRVDLRVQQVGNGHRMWDVARDVVPDLHEDGQGNPHSDRFGNGDCWYFFNLPPGLRKAWATEKIAGAAELAAFRGRAGALKAELRETLAALEELSRRQTIMRSRGAYETVYGVVEGKSADARLQRRGDPTALGAAVPRSNLAMLGGERLPAGAGSGRLQLASWLTRRENPLTARVIANRIWQRHFGHGIVRTENDFGSRGEPPTHPALLDWLAIEMIRGRWSMKRLHRRIMGSAAYQQVSRTRGDSAVIDPEGKWLWRFPRRRLSAEELRDSILLVAGLLDQSVGQAHPFPPVSSWNFTQHGPFYGLYTHRRRTVYTMQQRLKRNPFLALFDGPDPNATTPKRQVSTVPTQALYLMNSSQVHLAAETIQQELSARSKVPAARVRQAFRQVLAREPTDLEMNRGRRFLTRYAARAANIDGVEAGDGQALNALLRTLLVRNEFLFLD
ncbi:MAG: PSD1 and planctomycete cytochrome C domain-containing protein [Planctomycetota bacterium]|nr:PSD1 and planctomycete cytochrome C domain-containing protein [Planctomycetota bacterium]